MELQILTALTIGLTEVIKRTNTVDIKFIPLTSVAVGVVLSLTGGLTPENLIIGITVGLIGAGIYDNVKSGAKIAGIIK